MSDSTFVRFSENGGFQVILDEILLRLVTAFNGPTKRKKLITPFVTPKHRSLSGSILWRSGGQDQWFSKNSIVIRGYTYMQWWLAGDLNDSVQVSISYQFSDNNNNTNSLANDDKGVWMDLGHNQ